MSKGFFLCLECGIETVRTAYVQKRCKPCVATRERARLRQLLTEKRRKRGAVELGGIRPCLMCSAPIVFNVASKKHCDDCRRELGRRNSARVGNTPEAIERRKQAWAAASPQKRLNNRIRARLRESLRQNYQPRRWREALGYSMDELRRHLERQFLPKMTWENMSSWHVDHIIPLSAHSFSSIDDPGFKQAWALTNLRPMWAADNLKKSSRREVLI